MPNKLLIPLVFGVELTLIAVAIVIGVVAFDDPMHQFEERRFITWVSAGQLVLIGLIGRRIMFLRRAQTGLPSWKSPLIIWELMHLGFFFLAIDEAFQLHENFDHLIHHVFGITETPLTDRIDDVLVGLYGVVGLVAVWFARGELRRYIRALPWLIVGFVMGFTMVGLDLLTSKSDVLSAMLAAEHVGAAHTWLSVAEESCKVLAEGCFLLAFMRALAMTRALEAPSKPVDDGAGTEATP